MSYEQKYLKYKQKYLELKRQLESQPQLGGNAMSAYNLTETPVQQKGGIFGLFKDDTQVAQQPDAQQPVAQQPDEDKEEEKKQEGGGLFSFLFGNKEESEVPVSERNYDLTATPSAHTGEHDEEKPVVETEVVVGPAAEMKQYSVQTEGLNLSDTPTMGQTGGFFGNIFGSDMAPASNPVVDTTNCIGIVNGPEVTTPVDVNPEVAPVATPEVAPVATPEVAPVVTPEVAPVATPEVVPVAAPEVAPVATPEVVPVAAPEVVPVAAPEVTAPVEAAPVEAAPVEAAPVEVAPVEAAPVEAAPQVGDETGRKILSQYKDEINNTEDIEKLFSQLGGNLSELNSDSESYSESSYDSDSEQLSLSIS
jgi:hypothetical protein